MTNFQEWRIFGNDEYSRMTKFGEWEAFRNDQFLRTSNFWEWRIFGNDGFFRMMNFWESRISGMTNSSSPLKLVWSDSGLWVVVYLLNGHLSKDLAPKMGYQY